MSYGDRWYRTVPPPMTSYGPTRYTVVQTSRTDTQYKQLVWSVQLTVLTPRVCWYRPELEQGWVSFELEAMLIPSSYALSGTDLGHAGTRACGSERGISETMRLFAPTRHVIVIWHVA
eukprot:2679146-Rhodomonas_salina.2